MPETGRPRTGQPASALGEGGSEPQVTDNHRRYWRKNLRLSSLLLLIWFLVSFGVGFFARELNFSFFGWPFSFWVGAQGSLVVYLAIIGYYARTMNRLDREHGVAEDD